MEIDLTSLNGMPYENWYDTPYKVRGYPREHEIRNFIKGLDVVLFAETPLNYDFYKIAREMGVKTAVVINWEFFDHTVKPELPLPDLIIMPSTWYLNEALDFGNKTGVKITQIHHPVDREEMPFRLRTTNKLMHVAGNPAVSDRNGTLDFLNSYPQGIVTTQNHDLAVRLRNKYRHSHIYTNIQNPKDVYDYGDILILPRRYGGNCLPMNEALSRGMPVIMPDITPNNDLLPKDWLVPAQITDTISPRFKMDVYSVDFQAFIEKLRWARECDIEKESKRADEIANKISWETLLPRYINELENLCKS